MLSRMGEKALRDRWPVLYDLSLDPSENYNVIDTYPDVVKKLEGMLVQWEKTA